MSTPGGSVWGATPWAGGAAGTGGSSCTVGLKQAILYPALRKAGITLGPQRTPSPAQYQDAIDELNRLIGSFNCDRLNIYTVGLYQYSLTGAKTFTIGIDSSGQTTPDCNGPRPERIERANIIYSVPQIRRPLALVTHQQWSQIVVQDIANTISWALYDDYAYPVSTLYIYPQPVPGYILELYQWQLVPTFVTSDDIVCLPPGYEDAFVLNLAVRLAPHFQRPVDPDVRQQARESLMRIQSINAPKPILDASWGHDGVGDSNNPWFTTTWGR
ncbi:MAG: hypothetical protein C5B60_08820 [Chloroflexi bacterium]|nr:MAG: hypothetical protein C5B60_08820 [Chloroflexota bacterium]